MTEPANPFTAQWAISTTTASSSADPSPVQSKPCSYSQAWDVSTGHGQFSTPIETSWPPGIGMVERWKAAPRTRAWLTQYNALMEARIVSEGTRAGKYDDLSSTEYQTQKVIGLLALLGTKTYFQVAHRPTITGIIRDFDHFLHHGGWADYIETFPCFARPCPIKPRHGFVDSVVVHSIGQVLDVLLETKKADKDAELLLMPVLTSRYSGVITTAGVALGLGNAGATSAVGRSVFIPAPANSVSRKDNVRGGPGGITTSPYIEFVEDHFRPVLVQLRDGPAPRGISSNWVPNNMKVEHVVHPSLVGPCMSLMEWEKYLPAEIKRVGRKGLVVWLPRMTLASHYAVQAITLELPVVTTPRRVFSGMELEASGTEKPLLISDYRSIAANLASRVLHPMVHSCTGEWTREAALFVMGVAHVHTLWPGGEDHLNALRGQGVALAIRLGLAVCLGEARHHRDQCQDSDPDIPPVRECMGPGDSSTTMPPTRDEIFEWALKARLPALIRGGCYAVAAFQDGRWHQNYGGRNWARVGHVTLDLTTAAIRFCQAPGSKRWREVSRLFDLTADAVHNSGQALSKFVGAGALNLVANEPVWGFLSPMVTEIVLGKVGARSWPLPQSASSPPYAVKTLSMMEVPEHVKKARETFETWGDGEGPDDEGDGEEGDPDDIF